MTYKDGVYQHDEYPKMMLQLPRPRIQDFVQPSGGGVRIPAAQCLQNFETACKQWETTMAASIVYTKQEEQEWLQQNENRENK